MYIKSFAGSIIGIDATLVTVEVSAAQSGMGLYLVGLPDNAVKESQERIRSAFEAISYKFPSRKIVVNLAPADLRKEGAAFDLPIALSILAATGQIESSKLDDSMVLGELSLNGELRPIKGALPLADAAHRAGLKRIILPQANAVEASVVEGIEVLGANSLGELVEWFNGFREIDRVEPVMEITDVNDGHYTDDFADVKGQSQVKRAFEIAAAGGHNIIMVGPPGSGKTMISRRMPSILPPLSTAEALETTKIYSVAGKLGVSRGLMHERPFRAPHHLTSQVALIGGGANPQPGEVSLANNGVLYLDELPEFGRNVLEVLRQPLEEREISISRAKYSVCYPANFTLVASMNPCPCGYFNHPTKPCNCSTASVLRYMGRISGPLLDRIDLHVNASPVPIEQINGSGREESSAEVRARGVAARQRQSQRFATAGVGDRVRTNSEMTSRMLRDMVPLEPMAAKILEAAMNRLQLSARAYDRIIRVARTIADLEGCDSVSSTHISEAVGYRNLDRVATGARL